MHTASFCQLKEIIKLYRPSERSLPAKLVPTLADRGCRVVSATDPHGRNLGFLDSLKEIIYKIHYQKCTCILYTAQYLKLFQTHGQWRLISAKGTNSFE
jgi:hypothetical protein